MGSFENEALENEDRSTKQVIKKISWTLLSDEFKSSPNDGHFERFPNMIPNPVIVHSNYLH